jgi:hypothetical protein
MLRRLDTWVLRCLIAGFDHFACLDAAHFDTTDSLLARLRSSRSWLL